MHRGAFFQGRLRYKCDYMDRALVVRYQIVNRNHSVVVVLIFIIIINHPPPHHHLSANSHSAYYLPDVIPRTLFILTNLTFLESQQNRY